MLTALIQQQLQQQNTQNQQFMAMLMQRDSQLQHQVDQSHKQKDQYIVLLEQRLE
jgi:hypothetical protein